MTLGDITAKLRHLLRPKHDYRDPAADADDLAPLAEDRPPTLAADIRPGAGEHRHGTRASRPDPPPR